MKILIVTNMYPYPENPSYGNFVESQVESIRRKGISIDLVFANGRMSKLNYFRGAWQVFWRSRRSYYDVVHAHYGLSGLMALCQRQSPVVISFCGSDVMDPVQGKISRLVSRWADLSIVKSHQLGRALGCGNIRILPNGVDSVLFRPMDQLQARKELHLDSDAHYILFAADPKRRVKRVDVAQQVHQTVRNHLESPIELIILHGHAPNEVPLYMNACDVLLLTSDWEGSPNVVKEAMACNLPIVSVDVGDVREIIKETRNCHICPQVPELLAEKILFVLKDGRRTDGREKVSHMSLENTAGVLIGAYRQLLKLRGRPVR